MKPQLWRLQVASSDDPTGWAKERPDERELVEVKARQLEGVRGRRRRRRQNCVIENFGCGWEWYEIPRAFRVEADESGFVFGNSKSEGKKACGSTKDGW